MNGAYLIRQPPQQPAVTVQLHSAGDASPLTALLLPHIFPICSVVAPRHRGASPPSVRRRTFTTGCQAAVIAGKPLQNAAGFLTVLKPTRSNDRGQHPHRGVERRKRAPAWICFRVCRKSFTDLAGHAQAGQTFIKTVEELVRERPLAPRARRDRVLGEIDFGV